nr:hypothetical protein [Tanacetum cinerariifolium]
METKDTLSSCSNSEAQQMQQIQDKAKKSCMYTQLAIPEFRDTLIQHMESVKKSIDERAKHKRKYENWVNERQMQTTEEKVDMSKALDASLVDTESSRTYSKEQETSSRSGNDAHDDDANIRPIYDEEPMTEYTQLAILEFRDTLIQHMESVKKSIDERAKHKREYENWVNERQMQTTEEKVDMSKALDASLVDTESSRTYSKEQETTADQGMMHMMMMQISDPYMMKSQ